MRRNTYLKAFPEEEVAGFLLSLMRSIEDRSYADRLGRASEESVSEVVKGFANGDAFH